MLININTDSTVNAHIGLQQHVQSVVDAAVHRFQEHITRVEVHLSNHDSQKSIDGDNRVLMEARVTGYQPVIVSDHAATLHQAITGAADKLKRALDSALGRLYDSKRHAGVRLADALAQDGDESDAA